MGRVRELLRAGDRIGGEQVLPDGVQVRDRLGSEPGVVALGAVGGERPGVVVATNDAARATGASMPC